MYVSGSSESLLIACNCVDAITIMSGGLLNLFLDMGLFAVSFICSERFISDFIVQ